jgi:hypothetical protein
VTDGRQRRAVEVSGHIIDSLILPRILDSLLDLGVEFDIQELRVGRGRSDPSYARIEIAADEVDRLDAALYAVQSLGAVPLDIDNARLEPAPRAGVAPDDFYSTTNMQTSVRVDGAWLPV